MRKLFILALFIYLPFLIKSQEIKLVDCATQNPIEDLFIFSENGKYLGFTDENGTCKIEKSISEIKIIGLIIKDTIISINNKDVICLNLFYNNLQEITIKESPIEVKDLYIEMLEKNWDVMQKKDTTFYYNFSYTISVPDSNWKESISGVLKVHARPDKVPRVSYCQINYDIDGKLKASHIYQYPTTNLFAFINIGLDFMYSKKKDIGKKMKSKIDNIDLKTQGVSMVFTMDKSNKKIETKQKSYFENELLMTHQVYSNEDNTGNGLNSFYRSSEYTKNSKKRVLRKQYYKKIVQKKGTFFLTELNLSLSNEIPKECLNYPVSLMMNYQNWSRIIKMKTQ